MSADIYSHQLPKISLKIQTEPSSSEPIHRKDQLLTNKSIKTAFIKDIHSVFIRHRIKKSNRLRDNRAEAVRADNFESSNPKDQQLNRRILNPQDSGQQKQNSSKISHKQPRKRHSLLNQHALLSTSQSELIQKIVGLFEPHRKFRLRYQTPILVQVHPAQDFYSASKSPHPAAKRRVEPTFRRRSVTEIPSGVGLQGRGRLLSSVTVGTSQVRGKQFKVQGWNTEQCQQFSPFCAGQNYC